MKLISIINENVDTNIQSAIDKMAKLTDDNQHTEALIVLAELVGMKKEVKILKLIQQIHQLEGHLPSTLGHYRRETSQNVHDKARRKFGKEVYDKIYSAL